MALSSKCLYVQLWRANSQSFDVNWIEQGKASSSSGLPVCLFRQFMITDLGESPVFLAGTYP